MAARAVADTRPELRHQPKDVLWYMECFLGDHLLHNRFRAYYFRFYDEAINVCPRNSHFSSRFDDRCARHRYHQTREMVQDALQQLLRHVFVVVLEFYEADMVSS